MPTTSTRERDEARAQLLEILQPGATVYTIVRHVARSGMMRIIDLYAMVNNEPRRITWQVCKAAGITYSRKHEGARMNGCGMDMCFAAVYELGHALWPQGTPTPHGSRNGQPDNAGGYALRKRDM